MRENIQEARGHSPDPIVKPVRENRAAGGKARLMTLHNEETKCTVQTG